MSDLPPTPYLDEATWRHGSVITTFAKIPAPAAGIFDAPSIYVCVNTEWWSHLIERIRVLTRLDAWKGDNAEQVRASQEIEKLLAMANCEDCSDFITDIRVDPDTGQIEKKVGGSWVPADGDGGDTTIVNNIENITEQLYPDPPDNSAISNNQKACNVATGIIDYVLAKFDDMLDVTDATFDTIAAADGILALFPPLYIIADQSTDLVNEIVEASTSALRALITVSLREDMICYLSDAIDTQGRLTDANYSDAIDSVLDAITLHDVLGIGQALKNTFTSISKEAFISRANLYQAQNEVCPCGACYVNPDMEIAFSTDDARWILDQGTYDPDTGVISSDTTTGIIDLIFCLRRDAITEFDWLDSSNADDITPGCFYDATHVELEWRGLDIVPPPGGSATFHRMATTQADVSPNITHWNTTSSIGGLPTDWLPLSDDFVIANNDAFYLRVRFETENLNAPIEIRNLKLTVALP